MAMGVQAWLDEGLNSRPANVQNEEPITLREGATFTDIGNRIREQVTKLDGQITTAVNSLSNIKDTIEPIRETTKNIINQSQTTLDELRQGSTFEMDSIKSELQTKTLSDSLHKILTTTRDFAIPRDSLFQELRDVNQSMQDLRSEAESNGLQQNNCAFLDERGIDKLYRTSLEEALKRVTTDCQDIQLDMEEF